MPQPRGSPSSGRISSRRDSSISSACSSAISSSSSFCDSSRSRPQRPASSWTSAITFCGTGYLAKSLSRSTIASAGSPAAAAFQSESGVIR